MQKVKLRHILLDLVMRRRGDVTMRMKVQREERVGVEGGERRREGERRYTRRKYQIRKRKQYDIQKMGKENQREKRVGIVEGR